MKNKKNKNKL